MTGTPWTPRVVTFLLAEALSSVGSLATMVAVWGYAAFHFDASPGELSLYGLAFSIPGVVLGPLSGAVIDRVGPKATLAGSKALGIVASLLLLTVDTFMAMVVLTFLHGVSLAFAEPALQSTPPRLVDASHLARTNALVSMTDDFSLVAGPAVAGLAIAAFGFKGAFVIDALTYALGLVVLPIVRLRAPIVEEDNEPTARLREVFAGWSLVRRTPMLRRTIGCTFVVFFLYGLALLAEPLYVRDVLHRSPDTFAALQTAFGLCLIASGILVARLGDRIATFGWVRVGVLGSGVASVLYLGTPWLAMAFFGVAVWGLFTAFVSGPSRTVLQRNSPESAHGRVLATDLVASNGALLLGTAVSGPMISWLGVRATVVVFGAVAVAAAIQAGVNKPLVVTRSTESVL